MGFLEDIDETKPDGATEPVSVIDNYMREHRVATRATMNVEHFRTGEHKFLKGATGARPTFGKAGRIYFNDTTGEIEYDTGAAWVGIGYFKSRIKTGTYTGDGGATKAITGVGFTPTIFAVFPITGTNAAFIKTANFGTTDAHKLSDNTTSNDAIRSLDSDGATVGLDANVNAAVYAYIALKDL